MNHFPTDIMLSKYLIMRVIRGETDSKSKFQSLEVLRLSNDRKDYTYSLRKLMGQKVKLDNFIVIITLSFSEEITFNTDLYIKIIHKSIEWYKVLLQ